MTEITLPHLSDSTEEATIIKWLKRDGERITADEELVEVETDKATVTIRAEHDGLLSIVAGEGALVAVGELIARVAPASEQGELAPEIGHRAAGEAAATTTPAPNGPTGRATPSRAAAGTRPVQDLPDGDTMGAECAATPLARRAARLHGVQLAALAGTGPRGRITREDVLMAAGASPPPEPADRPGPVSQIAHGAASPEGPSAFSSRAPTFDGHRLSRVQQLIARRMTESRAAIPEFEVQTEVVMDEAVALRERLRAAADDDAPLASINDLIIRACALTLRRHPRLNASYADEELRVWPDINIGVAVATDDALLVPTVRGADRLSLGEIARQIRQMSMRARGGEISPAELDGGTFTVSNLGMFGMTSIRPVINPPQVAILGVGAVRETLARAGGEIVDRRLMTLTLSADHRAVYGADAARFLADLRNLLQEPLRVLV